MTESLQNLSPLPGFAFLAEADLVRDNLRPGTAVVTLASAGLALFVQCRYYNDG